MSKYSLQTECLENIEAFSDEHINREMAVIESVLEIFDKTILMMELFCCTEIKVKLMVLLHIWVLIKK